MASLTLSQLNAANRKMIRQIAYLSFCALFLFARPLVALAEEKSEEKSEEKKATVENCSLYRAKREKVPVYEKPTQSSPVVRKLILGEKVCYVGEQKGFAIIDWRLQEAVNSKNKKKAEGRSVESKKPQLVFVRLVDLWAPPPRVDPSKPGDMVEQVKRYFYYMRYGGVPEDILGPFRPYIDPFSGVPECQAGKICEMIEKEQEELKKNDNDLKKD